MTEPKTNPWNFKFDLNKVYQEWQDLTSWYQHSGERDTVELAYLALGISGEAGEHADVVKKILRVHGDNAWEDCHDDRRLQLVGELGDVLWYTSRMCTFLQITIHELMLLNIVKLYQRLHEREESGLKEIQWPLNNLPYEDALSLTQDIESRITSRSASHSTDTDT